MNKEQLKRAFDLVQHMYDFIDEVKEVLNIDAIEVTAIEDFFKMFELLIETNFDEYGQDWIFWWCYENELGKNKLDAFDKNGNKICSNFDELYEFVSKYKKC